MHTKIIIRKSTMDNIKPKELLDSINAIMKENNSQYDDNTTDEYSIFNVLNVWHDESTMCLVLADLLNPRGQHNTGTYFLSKFLHEMAPNTKLPTEELSKTIVDWEYELNIFDRDRRMDIYVHNEALHFGFPIEIKIWANDRESQCYDYYEYARRNNAKSCIVYLTLDGHAPSDESIYKFNDGKIHIPQNNILCLSFNKHIKHIIESILHEDIASESLKIILKQYLKALIHCDNTTIRGNNIVTTKTYELISSNDENLKAAFEIEDALRYVKRDIILEVFKEFDRQMQEPNKYGHIMLDSFSFPLRPISKDLDYIKPRIDEYLDTENKEAKRIYIAYEFEGLHPYRLRTTKYDANQIIIGLMLFAEDDGYLKLGIYAYDLDAHDFFSVKNLQPRDINLSEYFDCSKFYNQDDTCLLKSIKVPNDIACPCFKPFDIKAQNLMNKEAREDLVQKIISYLNNEFLRRLWK